MLISTNLRRVAALVWALGWPLAQASGGGEELPPTFSGLWGPVGPVTARIDGPLGVVEASWWRRPLLLAWLRMNGHAVPAGAEAAFAYAPQDDQPGETPQPFWVIDGRPIAPDLPRSATPPTGLSPQPGAGDWDEFENCPADAWTQARRTLAERVQAWGADSPATRDWVAMQHRVFARCPLGPSYFLPALRQSSRRPAEAVQQYLLPEMALSDAPPGSPLLLRQDRAYQRASAQLYEGRYDEAEAAFNAIAADTASPWQAWGRYLALRAGLRRVALLDAPLPGYDPCDTPACQQARRAQRERRAAEGTRLRQAVQQAIVQASGPARAGERARLQRLHSLVAARLDPAERLRELSRVINQPGLSGPELVRAVHDYLHLQRQQPPSEPMGEWLAGLVDGGDPTDAPCPLPASGAASSAKPTPDRDDPAQRDCRRQRWSQVSLQRHAREPQAWAWLFSAAALARPGDPHQAALLTALATVPAEHPAAPSLAMERLRLAPAAEVPRLAEALWARPELRGDMSARNRVREARLWRATTLAAFWADALREPGASQDPDTLLKGAPPPANPPSAWDRDAWWVLNQALPEALLLETARRAPWPLGLRQSVAWGAWSRAVLRRDAPAARAALDTVVALQVPRAEVATLAALAAQPDEARWLRAAALGVRRGAEIGTLEVPAAEGDCRLGASGAAPVPRDHFARQLLNPAQRTAWQRERAALDALPDQDRLWMQAVLDFAAAEPRDPRVPDLLKEAVYATRLNWCTAPEAGALSKQAFELLKRRYPDSAAARSTRYWFKPGG